MGLDMWLNAKTNKREYKEGTGVSGGIFPLKLDDKGMVEIGYWRKAYDQQDLILNTIKSYDSANDNCTFMLVTKDEAAKIVQVAKETLEEATFNEYGEDIDSEYATFMSETKWKDTIEAFSTALEIMEEDPDAEIYFSQWY